MRTQHRTRPQACLELVGPAALHVERLQAQDGAGEVGNVPQQLRLWTRRERVHGSGGTAGKGLLICLDCCCAGSSKAQRWRRAGLDLRALVGGEETGPDLQAAGAGVGTGGQAAARGRGPGSVGAQAGGALQGRPETLLDLSEGEGGHKASQGTQNLSFAPPWPSTPRWAGSPLACW